MGAASRSKSSATVSLPAVGVDPLADVALRIHEPHGHHGNSQVAALLEAVPGQKAQATGVKRQGAVEAVLQGEIGDGVAFGCGDVFGEPADLGLGLPAELGQGGVKCRRYSGLAAAASRAAGGRIFSSLTGLWPESFQAMRSSFLKSMRAAGCQDHQRLKASSPRPARRSGKFGKRSARSSTRASLIQVELLDRVSPKIRHLGGNARAGRLGSAGARPSGLTSRLRYLSLNKISEFKRKMP